MANSYTQFCAELPNLSDEEVAWFCYQLEKIYVYNDGDFIQVARPDDDPYCYLDAEYSGLRFFYDFGDSVGSHGAFDTEFVEEGGETSLAFSAEETGEPWAVAALVQEFLLIFRPKAFWVLDYCSYSARLTAGSCGGGTLIVTATEIHDSLGWCQRMITELSDDNTLLN